MGVCYEPYCYNLSSRVHTKCTTLLKVYSCDIHTSYYCVLCNDRIVISYLAETDIVINNAINYHFMLFHTLRTSAGNHLHCSEIGVLLVGRNYYTEKATKSGICHVSDILKTYPHFIYLVPQFSISEMLDQYDNAEISGWQLLASIRNKTFACLACSGLFESFPSKEVFSAHPCNEL